MGYYTAFTLEIENLQKLDRMTFKRVVDAVNNLDELEVDDIGVWSAYTKWYDYDKDMVELSKKFPTVIFKLYGDGEDFDDEWMTYFKNGRAQFNALEISRIYHDFDESKLQEVRTGADQYQ